MQKDDLMLNLWTKNSVIVLACIIFLVSGQSVIAADYLDELASEAEATASVSRKSQLSPTEKKELKEMEAILADKKPSTYKFYSKLNKKNKEHAYELWAADSSGGEDRMHHLQKKVMDLYFSQ